MGRKKRKQVKPWCWYCNRDFEDVKILIHHQKAKHFKCPFCHRKLFTGPGLSIHCNAVHKEKLDKIPNALAHRSSTVIDIYGMSGVPEADLQEHERQKLGHESDDGPPEKMERLEDVASSSFVPPLPPFPFMHPSQNVVPYMPVVPGGAQPFFHGVVPAPPPPPPPPPPPTSEVTTTPGDMASPKPTFPAYSEVDVVKSSAPKIIKPVSGLNGITVELVYPEEDLSLEELMAAKPKYQEMLRRSLQLLSASLVTLPTPILPTAAIGMLPPYVPLARGIVNTTGIPFMPLQQPIYGMPGYPQPAGQMPPAWMGLPNVRF